MTPDDKLTQAQIGKFAEDMRKALAAEVVVILASGHDPKKDAHAYMACCDIDPAKKLTGMEKTAHIVATILIAGNNVVAAKTTCELIINHSESGKSFTINDITSDLTNIFHQPIEETEDGFKQGESVKVGEHTNKRKV